MSLPLERPSQEDIDLARFQDNYTRKRFVEVLVKGGECKFYYQKN